MCRFKEGIGQKNVYSYLTERRGVKGLTPGVVVDRPTDRPPMEMIGSFSCLASKFMVFTAFNVYYYGRAEGGLTTQEGCATLVE